MHEIQVDVLPCHGRCELLLIMIIAIFKPDNQ
jgi:hypothetical protein